MIGREDQLKSLNQNYASSKSNLTIFTEDTERVRQLL